MMDWNLKWTCVILGLLLGLGNVSAAINKFDLYLLDNEDDLVSPDEILEAPKLITQEADGTVKDVREAFLLDAMAENTMNFIRLFTGKYYGRAYKDIEQYLNQNVDAKSNLKETMDALEDWLAAERAKSIKILNLGLIQALEQLLSLRLIMLEENRCSRRSYASLFKNDQATAGQAHKPPSETGKLARRVDWIVHQFEMRHALFCHSVYPAKFDQVRSVMDEKRLKRVETFTDNLIERRRKKFLSRLGPKRDEQVKQILVAKDIKSVRGNDFAEVAFEFIQKQVAGERRNSGLVHYKTFDADKQKVVLDRERLDKDYEEFIVGPCQYYLDQLGPDVFIPSKFDTRLLEKEDRSELESVTDFYMGYQRFRLCKSLLMHDKQSLFEGICKAAERQKVENLTN